MGRVAEPNGRRRPGWRRKLTNIKIRQIALAPELRDTSGALSHEQNQRSISTAR